MYYLIIHTVYVIHLNVYIYNILLICIIYNTEYKIIR